MNGFEKEVKENGKLPHVTDLGGYPLIYFNHDGNILCGDCATNDPERICGRAAYFEGTYVECDGCNERIESAYGDPEDEEEHEEDSPESPYGKDIDCKHCDAKESVHISNSWANSCGECGGEHNGFGQPLAPREQWGHETGEEGDF